MTWAPRNRPANGGINHFLTSSLRQALVVRLNYLSEPTDMKNVAVGLTALAGQRRAIGTTNFIGVWLIGYGNAYLSFCFDSLRGGYADTSDLFGWSKG